VIQQPVLSVDLIAQPPAPLREAFFFSPDERLAGDRQGQAPRILIVEDDYVVGLEVENGLGEAGFEVVGIANSAAEAVRMSIAEHPILAIMDIRLTGRRDGVEAAIEMFNACGIRCIFATAHHDAETRARAEKATPLGWLAKPYQLDTLISTVNLAIAELKTSRS
jgi:two-component system, response regulator PdtaR